MPPARIHGKGLVVIGVEIIREPAKKHGHGNIRFAMTKITGRIKNSSFSAGARHVIASPQIAVYQSRFFDRNQIRQFFIEGIKIVLHLGIEKSVSDSQIKLNLESFLNKKLCPGRMKAVVLSQ